ncbi:MAG: type II toxin-antitoxin system RelE/ParE family toxin [Nanoarchaeota archaeon]|nr:type II toxin-antitoxin system RelE/ParE family toxin [Nanoarchaeota archaeon]
MPWKIELSEEAFRDLSKIDAKEARRIVRRLESAAKDPKHYFKRLKGCDDYKLKVGDYRILALLLHEKKIIFVEKIGHRRNVYKEKHI